MGIELNRINQAKNTQNSASWIDPLLNKWVFKLMLTRYHSITSSLHPHRTTLFPDCFQRLQQKDTLWQTHYIRWRVCLTLFDHGHWCLHTWVILTRLVGCCCCCWCCRCCHPIRTSSTLTSRRALQSLRNTPRRYPRRFVAVVETCCCKPTHDELIITIGFLLVSTCEERKKVER